MFLNIVSDHRFDLHFSRFRYGHGGGRNTIRARSRSTAGSSHAYAGALHGLTLTSASFAHATASTSAIVCSAAAYHWWNASPRSFGGIASICSLVVALAATMSASRLMSRRAIPPRRCSRSSYVMLFSISDMLHTSVSPWLSSDICLSSFSDSARANRSCAKSLRARTPV